MVVAWIRLIAAVLFMAAGVAVMVISVIGVNRFQYALNRMHIAAASDSFGLPLILIGMIILSGFTFASLKLFALFLFCVMGNPVASHLLCNVEIETNEEIDKECGVMEP